MKFRKKPVVIEAVQWTGVGNCDEVFEFLGWEHCDEEMNHDTIFIPTLEGTMEASPGDWIVKGIQNEFYPVKPDIFEATYEPVES